MKIRRLPRILDKESADSLIGAEVESVEDSLELVEETIIKDAETGQPILIYGKWPGSRKSLQEYRAACMNLPYSDGVLRSGGIRNVARTFGFAPKNVVLKRESCRPSGLATESPENHAIISGAAGLLQDWLMEHLPEVVEEGWRTDVATDWRLTKGAYWTSGVVNRTSQLPYHRDRNNFPVWSVMPVIRRGVRGGGLHIPEYGVTIPCRDGWVVAFGGRTLVHGVTPMTRVQEDGYRISAVYYCLKGMANCAEDAVEQARARERRTQRERSMADEASMSPEALRERLGGWRTMEPDDDESSDPDLSEVT